MAKWTREIAIRVSPGGKDHPNLSEYLARARKVAGTLAEQSDLAGRTFGSRYEDISEDASVQATYNNAIKNGVPQVSATINLTPPKKPPAQPRPSTPEIELFETPTTVPSFKGAITFFVGDETHSVYSPGGGNFTPTATYIEDEAALNDAVGALISRWEAYVGVINVKSTSHPNDNVRPIPPYVQEYVAERQSSNAEVAVNDYIAAIDQALATFPQRLVGNINAAYFILDNSGSMRLTSVPEEVKEYLRSKNINQITVEETPTERWIKFTLDYFINIL